MRTRQIYEYILTINTLISPTFSRLHFTALCHLEFKSKLWIRIFWKPLTQSTSINAKNLKMLLMLIFMLKLWEKRRRKKRPRGWEVLTLKTTEEDQDWKKATKNIIAAVLSELDNKSHTKTTASKQHGRSFNRWITLFCLNTLWTVLGKFPSY